jgi:anthranilate synthase component 1
MILSQFPDKQAFKSYTENANVIPVCKQILADMETPVSIMHKFYDKNCESFLLESVEGGERWARYSFLGLSAYGTVKVFSDDVVIKTKTEEQTIAHDNDPLSVIREFSNSFKPARMNDLPRFWSGLTGYFSYEMVSFFEQIPVSLPHGEAYGHFMIPDQMIIFDNINQTLTCMKICYLDGNENMDEIYDNAVSDIESMVQTISLPAENSFRPVKANVELTCETDKADYIKGVEQIKEHIVDGDIFQAVYSQAFSCEIDVDPLLIYRAQRYINPSPYMFFMNFKDLVIAGSSPETMVRLENKVATLRPIAGTRPRGKTEQEDRKLGNDLLNDEKEKAEHVMLIDLGRNDLGRIAKAGSIQVTDTMVIEKYSHVMHLVSNITCDIKSDCDAYDLFKATFPAGTLSGAPKIRAMEIISQLEKRPRRIYGGAAGYISFSGNMDFAITIRTAVMEENKLTVQAGAGIVYDSDPEKEHEECRNKAKSVETALKLALSHSSGGR